jgi:DNA-binding NarL/FixJ family response regulator
MKVLTIDDHPLIRDGIRNMLLAHAPDAELFEAARCDAPLPDVALDLVLVDLGLPGLSGIGALELVRGHYPDVPAVVLSAADDRDTVLAALRAGAMGFIPKTMRAELIHAALKLVLEGGVYLPTALLSNTGDGPREEPRPSGRSAVDAAGMSPRQRQILRMVAEGLSNKLIARRLTLSEATVKAHVSGVLRALHVTSRTQALFWLSRHGITLDDIVQASD